MSEPCPVWKKMRVYAPLLKPPSVRVVCVTAEMTAILLENHDPPHNPYVLWEPNLSTQLQELWDFISLFQLLAIHKKLQRELHDKAMTGRHFNNPCFKTTVRKNDTVDSK